MGKTLMMVMAAAALLLAAVWMWLWWNKDRYQYVPSEGVKYAPAAVFDRNTGEVR